MTGTDCLGFVQRTASYRNVHEDNTNQNTGRIYSWTQLGRDHAEAAAENTAYGDSRGTVYPYESAAPTGRSENFSTLIVSREKISNMQSTNKNNQTLEFFSTDISTAPLLGDNYKGPSPENFKKLQNKFLSIVSGDVIFYGGLNSAGTLYSGHHIGEIANVDYTMIRNATTINQLLQSVTVIECVFNGKVNYVIKRNMFALGYEADPLTVTTDTAGSWKFQTKNWQDPFKIEHLRDWEIRRLNSK